MQDDLGDKVVHPQTKKPGIVPVQEGKEPQSTTPSGLAGPMGRSEDKRRGGYRRGGAMPINLALTQLVKFKIFGGIRQRRVDRKERDRVSAAAHGPSGKKPAGKHQSLKTNLNEKLQQHHLHYQKNQSKHYQKM